MTRVEQHGELLVVRDDLLPGGTKSRFARGFWAEHDEVVYASPAFGGMQLALAYAAQELGTMATIFVAHRRPLHPRTLEARAAGAMIMTVRPGYLSQSQAHARAYAVRERANYVGFGGWSEQAAEAIAEAAAEVRAAVGHVPQVWCAGGSGLLSLGLQLGITDAEHHVVQVGRELKEGGAIVHRHPLRFEQECRSRPPFPSCPNYDAKAWEIAQELAAPGSLFWNVLGPSPTIFAQETSGKRLTSAAAAGTV